MEHLPEEVDVPGLADHVGHLVEGDRGVVEAARVGLGVAEEAVDGSPRHGEGVADLEEELVGEMEAAGSEVRVEARLRRVLLLVEDGADSEEVVRVHWGGGGLGVRVESQGNEAVADQGLGECGSLPD